MILQNEWYVTNSRSLPQLIKIALITIANSFPHSLHQKTIFNQTRLQFLSVLLEKFSHRKCSEMVPVTADWTDIFTQSSSEKESSWHVPKSVAVLQPLLLATLHFWGPWFCAAPQGSSLLLWYLKAVGYTIWLTMWKVESSFIRAHKKPALWVFSPWKINELSKQKLKVVQREYLGHHLNLKILTYPGQQRACIQKTNQATTQNRNGLRWQVCSQHWDYLWCSDPTADRRRELHR